MAFNHKTLTAKHGKVTLVMANPSGLAHAIAVEGHGIDKKGKTVNKGGTSRVTVTLKKKGELLQVFIGKTKMAEYEKAIPAALQFDAMSFELTGVSANDRMFIGNIRIAKN